MLRHIRMLAFAGCCLVFAAPASATSLSPGGSVSPATLSSFNVDSKFTVLGSNTFNYTVDGNAGTLREEVLKVNSTGKLDFLYQFTNTGGPGVSLTSGQSFAGVTTDVFQTSSVTGQGVMFNPGKDSVAMETRSASPGSTLTFTYTSPLTSSNPGFVQIIETDAIGFSNNGSFMVASGTTSSTINGTSQPLPTPEPATLAMWCSLFGGLVIAAARKKWQWSLVTPQGG